VLSRFLPLIAACFVFSAPVGARAEATTGPGWEDSGVASWYGGWHDGRRTSSGEIFDSTKLTAAHSNLPLGSRIRVTVSDTGRSVVVVVNDRQPPKGLRVIDLSKAAASRLGIVNRGTAWVSLSPASSADEAVEVAEAPDEQGGAPTSLRRGRPQRHLVPRAGAPAHPCCHVPSATPVQH
jgi:rare lipoprotein A (peptidoglycan hydrolase)